MKTTSRLRSFAGAACALLLFSASAFALAAPTMPLAFSKPMPLDEAVARLRDKTAIATPLSDAQMQELAIGLKERAFWSARVNDIKTVSSMQSKLEEAVSLSSRDAGRAFMDRDKFIADMREELGAQPGDSGKLTDLTSSARLGLVYDFQMEDATEFGRFQIGQDPELLDAAPCQELVRVEARIEERPWQTIWSDAGGKLYDGRMIARKDDPIWTRISDFGRPWPPFKYGSGMGVDDVFRDEAEEIGAIGPDDVVAPQLADFNQGLQASLPDASPALLESFKQTFGDQVDVGRDGKITWQGERIANLYEAALRDRSVQWSLDLGEATADTIAAGQAAGVDLTGARLHLTADSIRHADKVHGLGEARVDQRPITARDFKLVPHVWRSPDRIRQADRPGALVLEKRLPGQLVTVIYDREGKTPRWGVNTLYAKKQEGGTA